jgi:Protein of unknown function (DUF2961)
MDIIKLLLLVFTVHAGIGCNREASRTPPVVPPGISWCSLLSDATELKTLARSVEPGTSSKMFSSCSDTGKVMLANLAPKVTGDLDHGFFSEIVDTKNGVLATIGEFDGPGVVTWVWSANPVGTLLLFIDKQAEPVLKMSFADFLAGNFLPVRDPYASVNSFGHNLHFPIVHASHCKLVLLAPRREDLSELYYQVAWHALPATSPVHPFDPGEIKKSSELLKQFAARLQNPSKINPLPSEDSATYTKAEPSLNPGKTVELFHGTGQQAITGIQISAPSKHDLAGIWIDGVFDGNKTMRIPLHMLAGVSANVEDTQSLPATVAGRKLTLRWFMPFSTDCQLWASNTTSNACNVTVEVWTKPVDASCYPLRFHANFIHHTGMKTDDGNILTLAEAVGSGRIVGTVLGVDSRSDVWWGEGDHLIWLDDISKPAWRGTGTEDYFGFAWCSQGIFNHPFRGQTYVGGSQSHRIAHMYRYHVLDQLIFQRWGKFQFEAWGLGKGDMDWATSVMWYSSSY